MYKMLLKKMKAERYNRGTLAMEIGCTPETLGQKLLGNRPFTQDDIQKISNTLGISTEDIGAYFFAK